LEKAFKTLPNVEVVGIADNPELVVNSMPWNGLAKGSKATVYWELDIAEVAHPGEYPFFDIVYFPSNMRKELWIDNCKFLPMAVDFDYYFPMDVEPEYDVVYMGRMDRSYRQEYIDRLSKKFKVLNTSAERGVPTTKILSTGKCSFQVSEFSNLEQRNFEYSAVVPMVLENMDDLMLTFKTNMNYRYFNRGDYDDFEKQIEWCVNNYDDALYMRDRMVHSLKLNHTYVNRAETILKDVKHLLEK
jgi:hypothetical protein